MRTGRVAYNYKDITGQFFNRCEALEPVGRGKGLKWRFRCYCGNTFVTEAYRVKGGTTKSCGCWNRQQAKIRFTTHGMTNTPEYEIYIAIIQRCENPKSKAFRNYGARGIGICEVWRHSFSAFLQAVGRRPSSDHELDRENNNLGYIPGNVRWVLRPINMRNKRTNLRFAFGGTVLVIQDWANQLGTFSSVLLYRFYRGWPLERALTERARSRNAKRSKYRRRTLQEIRELARNSVLWHEHEQAMSVV